MARAKTVLEGSFGEGGKEKRAKEAFENFRGRTEKRDGAVGGAKVRGFTGFGYRENKGVFPNSG